MYDTSPESWAPGAIDRLLYMFIAFIHSEFKEKKQPGFWTKLKEKEKLL